MGEMASKVYIIDDEKDVALLMSKQIRALGYDVTCLYKGEGSLEKIRSGQPHLVFLDIRLPDISGIEIFKMLREDEECKEIPIVFFSAHSEQEHYCLNQLGATAFVKKPYDLLELKNLIKSILQ